MEAFRKARWNLQACWYRREKPQGRNRVQDHKGKCFCLWHGVHPIGGIKRNGCLKSTAVPTRKFSQERLQPTATSSRLARWMEIKRHPCSWSSSPTVIFLIPAFFRVCAQKRQKGLETIRITKNWFAEFEESSSLSLHACRGISFPYWKTWWAAGKRHASSLPTSTRAFQTCAVIMKLGCELIFQVTWQHTQQGRTARHCSMAARWRQKCFFSGECQRRIWDLQASPESYFTGTEVVLDLSEEWWQHPIARPIPITHRFKQDWLSHLILTSVCTLCSRRKS